MTKRKHENDTINIDLLKEYASNPRSHNEIQVSAMVESLKMFDQFRPVVIDEKNTILAGHCVVMALKKMGKKDVSVIRYTGLKEKEKAKLVLADNKIAELGFTDYGKVEDLIKDIGDFEIPGFDSKILEEMFASVDKTLEEYGNNNVSEIDQSEGGGFFDGASEEPPEMREENYPPDESAGEIRSDNFRRVECPKCGEIIVI